jgi:hypothetical protein
MTAQASTFALIAHTCGGCGVRPDTGCASGPVRPVWVQIAADPMPTPEQTPDTDQDVQELTDENLEEVSGGGVLLLNNNEIDVVLQAPNVGFVPPLH